MLPQHPCGDPYFSIYLWLSLDTLESIESIEILHTDTRNSGRRDGEDGSCRDSLIMIMIIILVIIIIMYVEKGRRSKLVESLW